MTFDECIAALERQEGMMIASNYSHSFLTSHTTAVPAFSTEMSALLAIARAVREIKEKLG